MGIQIFVAPNWSGYCENHIDKPKWVKNSNVFNRLKNLYAPLSGCSPKELFIFEYRHNGLLLAILHFFSTHFKCLFPSVFQLLRNIKEKY